jgi:pyridoxamine 5'-phosphate oxidase
MTEPADLRVDYRKATLVEGDLDPDPLVQLGRWFDAAVAARVPEPNAMTLATVDHEGRPAARVVLLKGIDELGLTFYSNYHSRKGRELEASGFAALVLVWLDLQRQVRVEGAVTRVDAAESDAYFASRPRASLLGAWASPQSVVIADRSVLEVRLAEAEARFPGVVPRPPHWGGYRVIPDRLELWQGRTSRLHDRLVYLRAAGGWTIQRLAP